MRARAAVPSPGANANHAAVKMPSGALPSARRHAPVADRVVGRRAHLEATVAPHHLDADDVAPRLAAVAAGVHRERAADGARNAGQEFRAGAAVHRGEARELRDRRPSPPRR